MECVFGRRLSESLEKIGPFTFAHSYTSILDADFNHITRLVCFDNAADDGDRSSFSKLDGIDEQIDYYLRESLWVIIYKWESFVQISRQGYSFRCHFCLEHFVDIQKYIVQIEIAFVQL